MRVLEMRKAYTSIVRNGAWLRATPASTNPLFSKGINRMLFGDAKKKLDEVRVALDSV